VAGDEAKAVELLGAALATARELGMEPLAGTASALLTELERIEVPPIGRSPLGHPVAAREVR
jgi:hypothetical protein